MQGEFLAELLAGPEVLRGEPVELEKRPAPPTGFKYYHKGALAYIGVDEAVMDIPVVGPVVGPFAGFAWKSFETMSQISFRNQCLVATDWVRAKVFGRDISRF